MIGRGGVFGGGAPSGRHPAVGATPTPMRTEEPGSVVGVSDMSDW